MSILRRLSTRDLIVLVLGVLALCGGGAAIAAAGGGGAAPPPEPLEQAVHDALAAPRPEGVTARIRFTNNLLPSGALLGQVGSPLMSGASGRLWLTQDGRGRLELQSNAGDAQIVWSPESISVYDASSNTVYRAKLPARARPPARRRHEPPPTRAQIDDVLAGSASTGRSPGRADERRGPARLQRLCVAEARRRPARLAGAGLGRGPGSAAPRGDLREGSTRARARARRHGHLLRGRAGERRGRVAARRREGRRPRLAVAHRQGRGRRAGHRPRGGAGRRRLPGRRAGVARRPAAQDVRLVGGDTALVLYGHGLGTIALVERKADASGAGSALDAGLPRVSLDGVTAHELATPLGTVLEWQLGRHELRARRLAAARGGRGGGAGREVSDAPPVEARGLVKRYGEIVAVDHVDLDGRARRRLRLPRARTARARRRRCACCSA